MSALLLHGDSERSPAIRHEIPVSIIDALTFLELDGRRVVLTSELERERIAAVLPEAELYDSLEFGFRQLLEDGHTMEEAEAETVLRLLQRLEVADTHVPGEFPLAIADRLRGAGIAVTVDDEAVRARRRAKTGHELDGVRAAQRAAEAAMAAAAAVLARAEPGADGRLVVEGAELHAEHVREELRAAAAAAGAPCPPDVMVVSVWQGYGHEPGSGPLPAGLPIVIDLWPRDEQSGCWADMTRTFIVGEPPAEHAAGIAENERLVTEALERARAMTRPGISGRELFEDTCELFERAGRRTMRNSDGAAREGFQFSLGHGVGLEVHEDPGLGFSGRSALVEGDVVAVEPGLWDLRFGGIRFEDLLLVTADGCETLTRYPYELTP